MIKSKPSSLILSAVCLLFFALGILTAGYGPLLSEFSVNTASSLSAVGGIYTALFCGALVAQLVSGTLSEKMGMIPLSIIASVILSGGLVSMTFSRNLVLLLAMALLTGLGHGTVNLSSNVMISCMFREKNVTAVNFINIFFGIGAVTGPVLVNLCLRTYHFGMPVLWCAAVLVLVSGAFMFAIRQRVSVQKEVAENKPADGLTLYRSPLLWAIGIFALIYMGTENAIGGWTATYLQQTVSFSLETASLVTAGFWLALTLGRAACAIMGTRLNAYQVIAISLSSAIAGVILFVLGIGVEGLSILALFLIGLGFGGIFPTTLALTTRLFTYAPGKAGSVIIAMGSIGSMLIPWLLGVVIEKYGPRQSGYLLAVSVLVMVAIFGLSQRRTRVLKKPNSSTAG